MIKFLKMTVDIQKRDDIKFCSKDHLILHYGKFFTEYAGFKTKIGVKKQCFMNATDLMLRHDLIYCEGYASCRDIPFPIEHAWCIDIKGKIIDNTWDNEEGNLYLGIPFSKTFVAKRMVLTQEYGIFGSSVRDFVYNGFLPDELWSGHQCVPLI